MRGIIFKTVKEGFRRLHKAHKAEVRRNKRNKGATPVIPLSLKKADFKRKIRGTKFTGAAEFKAQPGLKRRIRVGIERAKREKKKFRTPIVYGKAYASDKKGKTMQIQPLTSAQRKQMKKEMAASADRNYKKVRLRKFGYNDGGGVKKLLLGGLLTKGIKSAYKAYRKAGGRKTSDIMKQPVRGAGKRSDAKDDVKFGIRLHGKGRYLSQREINKLMK